MSDLESHSSSSSSSSSVDQSPPEEQQNKVPQMETAPAAGDEEPEKSMFKKLYYSFVVEPGTEGHRSQMGTAGWLRAGVLGANDALVSVSSIMVWRYTSSQSPKKFSKKKKKIRIGGNACHHNIHKG